MTAPQVSDRKQILVIEDEPDIVRGLEDALEFEGFEVHSAATGDQGISLAKETHPDCVLLDLMLPDDNGYRVCEQLRTLDPVVPIIMLTAKAQEADKIRGLEVGADDYVTKPFSVRELLGRSFYELELLKLLRERAEEPVSRDELLEKIWGVQPNPQSRTVDNFIVKLRRKLEEDHKNPKHILTVYGFGYKLVP